MRGASVTRLGREPAGLWLSSNDVPRDMQAACSWHEPWSQTIAQISLEALRCC